MNIDTNTDLERVTYDMQRATERMRQKGLIRDHFYEGVMTALRENAKSQTKEAVAAAIMKAADDYASRIVEGEL